jgi:hypothetical protein
MQCERCRCNLEENRINHFERKVVCEDCCFELMNPLKPCDPLAVRSTLNVRKVLGQTGTEGLTDLQKEIYNIVVAQKAISKEELKAELNLTFEEIERQFAVLRHCQLLRAFKEGGKVYFAKYASS